MNDQLAERMCLALEQLALELATANEKGTVPAPVFRAVGGALRPGETVTLYPQGTDMPSQDAHRSVPNQFAPIGPWSCPVHGTNRIVPGGVSKKTGKPYTAFMVCGEQGCDMKPPRGGEPTPQRAIAPSEQWRASELP